MMNLQILIILADVFFSEFATAQQGANVSCVLPLNCTDTNCGPVSSNGFLWVQGVNTQCSIADCQMATFPATGLIDNFCTSCPPSPTSVFANTAGTACVNVAQSCTSTSGFNDSMCNICSPNKPYANATGTACIDCTATTGLTDEVCAACTPKTPFAAGDTNSCVNPTQSCSATSHVIDSDCLLCYPAKPYANLRQTACVAPSMKCLGRDLTQQSQKWTDSDCYQCFAPSSKAKTDGSGCINCTAITGMTSAMCAFCYGTASGSFQYANSVGACVSVNCAQSSGWKNSTCATCNSKTPQASPDGLLCYAIIHSSILLASLFFYLLSLLL